MGGGKAGGLISAFNMNRLTDDSGKCTNDSRPIDMFYFRTLITIMFPPLGVFMAKGFTGIQYILLSCLLTSLFYFPGLIYSLSVISSSKHALLEDEDRKNGREQMKKKVK